MKRLMMFMLLVISPVLISGCATLPQRLTLQPSPPSVIGEGPAGHREISLRVIDGRPENSLGYLEQGNGNRQPFFSTRELDRVFDQAVAAGLRSKGFIPLAGVQDSTVSLEVEIKEFSHHVSPGVVKVPVQTRIFLHTLAVNGPRKLSGYYSVEKQEILVFRPSLQKNQQLVNEALDTVLEKIFQDRKLWALLSLKPGTTAVKQPLR